jgi:hypothetical protein
MMKMRAKIGIRSLYESLNELASRLLKITGFIEKGAVKTAP